MSDATPLGRQLAHDTHKADGPAAAPQWIYIAGYGRSGTTLLGLLLAQRSGFFCGELHLLWHALVTGQSCQCGEQVACCPVWTRVADKVRTTLGLPSNETGMAIMDRRLRRRHLLLPRLPAPPTAELELRAATEAAVAEVTESEVLVDSSKLSSVLWTACHIDRPLSVVHLVRDPRAVAFSEGRRKPDPTSPRGALIRRSVLDSTAGWIRGHVTTERVLRRGRAEQRILWVHRMRYEDLARDPAACVRSVGGAPQTGEHIQSKGHAVAGNPSRFAAEAPIVVDQRWRTEMPAFPRLVSTTLTAPLLWRYGYGLRPVGDSSGTFPASDPIRDAGRTS